MVINLNKLYLIRKSDIVSCLFYTAILLSFFGSMRVWFMLPFYSYYPILACFIGVGAIFVSNSMKKNIFSDTNILFPVFCYIILALYQAIVNNNNINAYIAFLFNAVIFYIIFSYDKTKLFKVSTFISKTMGWILLLSIPAFILYIFGLPLPYSNLNYNDNFYSFSNYYLFLIDDRSLFDIIPRFQSIFLEPTYLGSTTALLLQSQRGHWKRWYNVIMIAALLMSFSLAGYVYFIAIIFLNLWVSGKKIFKKAIICVSIIALTIGGSFIYNNGDNLLHDLIILRLEIEDGDLAGNNRVTEGFTAEYESYLESSDIIFGRDYDTRFFGDSGYKVFIFDYGIVGTILLFLFYGASFINSHNRRAMISAWILFLLVWGVDGFVLWFGRFIPLYLTAYGNPTSKEQKETELI